MLLLMLLLLLCLYSVSCPSSASRRCFNPFLWAEGAGSTSPSSLSLPSVSPNQLRPGAMASGFGVRGPVGRCYPVYVVRSALDHMLLDTVLSLLVCATLQEFADCLTVNGDATKCGDLREDYFECLHHSKEVCGALDCSLCPLPVGWLRVGWFVRWMVRVGWLRVELTLWPSPPIRSRG
mgnify:CR=1 FL=1